MIIHLDSTSLANQINNHLFTLPTNPVCGIPLVIENDNCLQYIYLQDNALSNIQSVVLSNLTNLSLIRTEHSLTQASSLTLSSKIEYVLVNRSS